MVKMFATFDVKAAQYGAPVGIQTRGLALRAFADVCANPQSPLNKYPEDYSLYEIGEYDQTTGKLKALTQPEIVCTAAAMIQQLKVEKEKEEIEVK